MRIARRALSIVCFAAITFSQEPEKPGLFNQPPPGVEPALQERIGQFYTMLKDKKYRQAEALVAEDTKDYYYTGDKLEVIAFEIKKIEYSDNFSKAKVTMLVERTLPIPGMIGKPIKVAIGSYWKMENGLWYWWVDPEMRPRSPLPVTSNTPMAVAGAALDNYPLRIDKQSVELVGPGTSAEVTISNLTQDKVTVAVDCPDLSGVKVNLAENEIAKNGKTTFTVSSRGILKQPIPLTLMVRVATLNQGLTLRVMLKPPAPEPSRQSPNR